MIAVGSENIIQIYQFDVAAVAYIIPPPRGILKSTVAVLEASVPAVL